MKIYRQCAGRKSAFSTPSASRSPECRPSAQIVAHTLAAAPGPALVFGSGERVNALDAALINGTASHALDFDDCNNTLGGHPSAPILPALFALAEQAGASGREFIAAYVAGFETECKIALGVNFITTPKAGIRRPR